MAKVNIGLQGWRFDEEDVLAPDGTLRPVEEMPEEVAERVLRLAEIVNGTCDVCWLREDDESEHANAAVVYGEPFGEVLLCSDHEPDFIYWYREAGGDEYRGSEELADAFHEWILDGGEAPEGYGRIEHVETDPGSVAGLPEVGEVRTGERIDLREDERESEDNNEGEPLAENDLAEADVDLDADYPG